MNDQNEEFNDNYSSTNTNSNNYKNLNNSHINEFSTTNEASSFKTNPNVKEVSLEVHSKTVQSKIVSIGKGLIATTTVVLITVAVYVPQVLFPDCPTVSLVDYYFEPDNSLNAKIEFEEEVIEPDKLSYTLFNDFESFEGSGETFENQGYAFFEPLKEGMTYTFKITYDSLEIYKDSVKVPEQTFIPEYVNKVYLYGNDEYIEMEIEFNGTLNSDLVGISMMNSRNESIEVQYSCVDNMCYIMFNDYQFGETFPYSITYNSETIYSSELNVPETLVGVSEVTYRKEGQDNLVMGFITFTDIAQEGSVDVVVTSNGTNIDTSLELGEQQGWIYINSIPSNEFDIVMKCGEIIIYKGFVTIPDSVPELNTIDYYLDDGSIRVEVEFMDSVDGSNIISTLIHENSSRSIQMSYSNNKGIGYLTNVEAGEIYTVCLQVGNFIIVQDSLEIPTDMISINSINYDINEDYMLTIDAEFNQEIDSSLYYYLTLDGAVQTIDDETSREYLHITVGGLVPGEIYVFTIKQNGIIILEEEIEIPEDVTTVAYDEYSYNSSGAIGNFGFENLANSDNLTTYVTINNVEVDSYMEFDKNNSDSFGTLEIPNIQEDDVINITIKYGLFTIYKKELIVPSKMYNVLNSHYTYTNNYLPMDFTLDREYSSGDLTAYYTLNGVDTELEITNEAEMIFIDLPEIELDLTYSLVIKCGDFIIHRKDITIPSNYAHVDGKEVFYNSTTSLELTLNCLDEVSEDGLSFYIRKDEISQEKEFSINGNKIIIPLDNLASDSSYSFMLMYDSITIYEDVLYTPDYLPTILSVVDEGGGSGGSQTITITFNDEVDESLVSAVAYNSIGTRDDLSVLMSGNEGTTSIYSVDIGETYTFEIYYNNYLIYKQQFVAKD